MNVCVPHFPNGAVAFRRLPHSDRPRRRHGLHRGFIDEHQTARRSLHGGLAVVLPVSPGRLDVGALLLRRQQRFFYM